MQHKDSPEGLKIVSGAPPPPPRRLLITFTIRRTEWEGWRGGGDWWRHQDADSPRFGVRDDIHTKTESSKLKNKQNERKTLVYRVPIK